MTFKEYEWLEKEDVHVVANLIKSFLREMDEPLCQAELYSEFVAAANSVEKHRIVVAKMDPKNYNVLKETIAFVKRVVAHKGTNKMTSLNMSLMMTPNIFRHRKGEEPVVTYESIAFMQKLASDMTTLIDHFDEIFQH